MAVGGGGGASKQTTSTKLKQSTSLPLSYFVFFMFCFRYDGSHTILLFKHTGTGSPLRCGARSAVFLLPSLRFGGGRLVPPAQCKIYTENSFKYENAVNGCGQAIGCTHSRIIVIVEVGWFFAWQGFFLAAIGVAVGVEFGVWWISERGNTFGDDGNK